MVLAYKQYIKMKQPVKKNKNAQKTWIDIFPKKIYW